MIPTIGIMIGAYIFTRMAELLGSKEAGGAVKFFAAITLLVSVVGTLVLMFSGSSLPPGLR